MSKKFNNPYILTQRHIQTNMNTLTCTHIHTYHMHKHTTILTVVI